MRCALCELPLDASRQPWIRFSNTNPPRLDRFRYGTAAMISALGDGFSAVIRAAVGADPEQTYWFHRDCWQLFSKDLLSAEQDRQAANDG